MKKGDRNNALLNGLLVGFGVGCLAVAGTTHVLVDGMHEILAIHGIPPTDLGSLFYLGLISGTILVALGIGLEAYQRARMKQKESRTT